MMRADLFHYIVARFLYVTKKTRPDLHVAIVFLCKQVKCPNMDDWKKLGRLVWSLQATVNLPLILGSDGTGSMV